MQRSETVMVKKMVIELSEKDLTLITDAMDVFEMCLQDVATDIFKEIIDSSEYCGELLRNLHTAMQLELDSTRIRNAIAEQIEINKQ